MQEVPDHALITRRAGTTPPRSGDRNADDSHEMDSLDASTAYLRPILGPARGGKVEGRDAGEHGVRGDEHRSWR